MDDSKDAELRAAQGTIAELRRTLAQQTITLGQMQVSLGNQQLEILRLQAKLSEHSGDSPSQ